MGSKETTMADGEQNGTVTVEEPTTDAASEKRYTRSFTPERGYDTVALVALVAPTSFAVDAETMASIEAKVAEAAIKILKTAIPTATEISTESSKRWTRVQGDSVETKRAPKVKSAGTSKRLDSFFEATIDLAKLRKRAIALADAKVKAGTPQADARRAALLEAAAEQDATEDQLRSLGLVVTKRKVDEAEAATETAEVK